MNELNCVKEMPVSGRISLVFLIEVAFILSTTFFLIQPKFIVRSEAQWLKNGMRWLGMLLLCLTFCWSVVVGIILGVSGLTVSI